MGTRGRANVKAQKAYEGLAERYGSTLIMAERRVESLDESDIIIEGLRVRFPQDDGDDYLVVVKARVEGTPSVGFHGGLDLASAIVGTLERLYNRTMKWKADEYA